MRDTYIQSNHQPQNWFFFLSFILFIIHSSTFFNSLYSLAIICANQQLLNEKWKRKERRMPNKTLKIKEKNVLLYVSRSRHKEHKSFSNHEREKKKVFSYKNIKSYYTFADVDIFFFFLLVRWYSSCYFFGRCYENHLCECERTNEWICFI